MQIKIITYVLDDDIEEVELLRPHLEKVCEPDLQMYTSVADFLAAIEEGCHIVIIDFRLNAIIDGIEVGKRVLEKNPLCFLIFYSGTESKQTLIRACNTGFDFIVDKNDVDACEQIANAVSSQLDLIRMRIRIFNKYYKQLTHEHAI